jgi:hypothetical protein
MFENDRGQSAVPTVPGSQLVGDYFVPEDPMDAFQCDSCQ